MIVCLSLFSESAPNFSARSLDVKITLSRNKIVMIQALWDDKLNNNYSQLDHQDMFVYACHITQCLVRVLCNLLLYSTIWLCFIHAGFGN